MMTITLYQQLDLMSNWKSALKRKAAVFSVKRYLLQNTWPHKTLENVFGVKKFKVCNHFVAWFHIYILTGITKMLPYYFRKGENTKKCGLLSV